MAGALQHHIPQFFSRGFRSPGGSKKQSQVWVYAKDREPHLAIVKDEVGVEAHFYSDLATDGSRTLDDEITDYEVKAARLLQELRGLGPESPSDSKASAEIVAHLTIRNAHLRGSFALGLQAIFGQAIDLFCNEDRLRAILGLDQTAPTSVLKDAIDSELLSNVNLQL
ncbi:DUF4238 domain-containing protein [Bradyrhizobium sp. CCBAU 53380]|uniref:DUF4238 domain-containing protein n=1 Tax=Bradyrhizobium sp. CCBAU 53380 TaxID=1325117 RepID=UPI002302F481|nr:DUF4238 domain-containing protein [Bradyrhizobium sp. CCBAU 53380]MDA9426228.1 hypothetical protein [Bradyrhizobium sp. CCBAU 53380]